MRIRTERFKEDSNGPEAKQINLSKPATLRLLEGIPTLLFYKQCITKSAADVIRYGTLHNVRRDGASIVFHHPGH